MHISVINGEIPNIDEQLMHKQYKQTVHTI